MAVMSDNTNHTFEYCPAEQPDHTPIYRSTQTKESGQLLTALDDGAVTLYHGLHKAIARFGDKVCFGMREVEATVEEVKEVEVEDGFGRVVKEKKSWKYFKLAPYHWVTFNQLKLDLSWLGAALAKLGCAQGNRRLAIYAPTSRLWSTMANASYTQNMTVVTIYDTLGSEGLVHGLNETETATIFIDVSQVGILKASLPQLPHIKTIITTKPTSEKDRLSLTQINPSLNLITYDELMELGKGAVDEVAHVAPTNQDLALIMYTSGTTGHPKGVMITHQNLISIVGGVEHMVNPFFKPDTALYLSFLPLAHILAFAVDCYFLHSGLQIAYGTPRTLTNASVRHCKGDLQEARPTILIGVPQVYDMIRKSIMTKVQGAGAVRQSLFHSGMWLKGHLSYLGLPTLPLDYLVFKRVREELGGRVMYCVSGGAPLSQPTMDFFNKAVGTMFQGYGLTEVCGLANVNTPNLDQTTRSVGQITPGLEFKLVSQPAMSYYATADPPRGELWFRGPALCHGYYMNEPATQEAFTPDGWFKTGDIAQINPNLTLSIIDRKKNLVKLANGEYIALEHLESLYKSLLYLQNICIVADSTRSYPIALVSLTVDQINQFLADHPRAGLNPTQPRLSPELSDHQGLTRELLNWITTQAKLELNLKGTQLIRAIYITPTEWTSDNQLLTTSQKLKRRELAAKFQANIDKLWASLH